MYRIEGVFEGTLAWAHATDVFYNTSSQPKTLGIVTLSTVVEQAEQLSKKQHQQLACCSSREFYRM